MKLDGTSVLITGGGSGLGAAVARRLSGTGAKVAVLDRDGNAAAAIAAEVGGTAVVADICDEAAVNAGLDKIEAAQGAPRLLVNCAGIGTAKRVVGREGPMPLGDFERVIRVNLIGTFNMIRLAAARMQALEPVGEERGAIISTASVAAFDGQIGQAAYAAAKGGIAAMTLPIARELARLGIRCMTVAPGLFSTPLLGELPPETRHALAAAIPFPGRLGEPDEFAALVQHIAENPYLNGETIRLDGALRMAAR